MKDSQPDRPKRNAPLWVKIFVPLHIVAITSWALPPAPKQYREHVEVINGVSVTMPPSVRLGIRTNSVPDFFQSLANSAQYGLLIQNEDHIKDSPLKFYLLSTGFWQYWDMFSPNPASVDQYADEVVFYADGSSKTYQYPRMFTLSLGEKFLKERWRKFFERAGSSDFNYLWPVFGQRIALINFDNPSNPPVRIEMHLHQMVVSAPDTPINKIYTDKVYYTYVVDQKALRRDKGL